MGATLDTPVPLAALMMALRQRQPSPGLIHHSDRGVQYANAAYRSALADHGLVASMSRKGNCYDNAAMEAFWSSLKNELVHRRRFATRADARTARSSTTSSPSTTAPAATPRSAIKARSTTNPPSVN